MTNAQGQDIFTGHRQSVCQFLASNYFYLQDMAHQEIEDFLNNDNYKTSLGLKQSLDMK